MTCEQAIQYIHSNSWKGQRPGLERIRALLAALGDPQKAVRCIHVAGTNGKGSVCAMLDSILRAAGYRVGLFTSPYIRRFQERMRADGEMIGDEELAEITEFVRPHAEAMEDRPNEFELITAIGFEFFRRRKVEYVVLEVGLGGRLDPTNIIEDPLLSIITDIDFDHTAQLGNTIQAIHHRRSHLLTLQYFNTAHKRKTCINKRCKLTGKRRQFFRLNGFRTEEIRHLNINFLIHSTAALLSSRLLRRLFRLLLRSWA